RPATHMRLWVDVTVDGHFLRAVAVPFAVHAFRAGWVAQESIPLGEDVGTARVASAEIDVATLDAKPWGEVPERTRARRTLRAGQALTVLDVELRPPVVRGDWVTL